MGGIAFLTGKEPHLTQEFLESCVTLPPCEHTRQEDDFYEPGSGLHCHQTCQIFDLGQSCEKQTSFVFKAPSVWQQLEWTQSDVK